MQPRPQAILFDLDGTLADTALDFYPAVNQLRRNQNKPELATKDIREQVSNGGYALAALAYDTTLDDPKISIYRQQLLQIYAQTIGQESNLFTGFTTVLTQLEQQGLTWGIVTNKPRYLAELFLQRIQLNTPVLVCPDDVNNSKPAPDALLLAAETLHIAAENCWYVGDHIRDIQAAKAANMYALAASFGYLQATDDIHSWHADSIIHTPLELLDKLQISYAN